MPVYMCRCIALLHRISIHNTPLLRSSHINCHRHEHSFVRSLVHTHTHSAMQAIKRKGQGTFYYFLRSRRNCIRWGRNAPHLNSSFYACMHISICILSVYPVCMCMWKFGAHRVHWHTTPTQTYLPCYAPPSPGPIYSVYVKVRVGNSNHQRTQYAIRKAN